jgi:phage shock protein PspC (stress-responsive transcriptional regulator)
MYCASCGNTLDPGSRFCTHCGTVLQGSAPQPFGGVQRLSGQLVRSRTHRTVAGVCGGLSEHFGWDLSLVRIVALVLGLFTGVGLVAYVVAWVVIPEGQYALPFGVPMPPPPPGSAGTASS